MSEPSFVQAGEPVKASTINDLITRTRNRTGKPPIDFSGEARIYRPFDPISIDYENSKWVIILKPSWIIEGNEAQEITFSVDDEDVPLTDYPLIEVEPDKNLYLDTDKRELSWETAPHAEKLLVIEVVEDTETPDKFEFVNKYPAVVHSGGNPPFWTTLHTTEGESTTHKISAKAGWVIERLTKEESLGAVYFHEVSNQTTDGADTQFTITGGESLFVKYTVGVSGAVDYASVVYEVAASDNSSSVHYLPDLPNGGGGGATGTMSIELAKLTVEEEKATLERRNTGHIDHFAELTGFQYLTDDGARVILPFDAALGKYKLHKIDGRTEQEAVAAIPPNPSIPNDTGTPAVKEVERQIKVSEKDGKVIVEGNGKKASLSFSGPGAPNSPLPWDDGLITDDSELDVTLPTLTSPLGTLDIGGGPLWNLDVKGETFSVEYYKNTIQTGFPDPGINVVSASGPTWTIWFLNGVPKLTEPVGWGAIVPTPEILRIDGVVPTSATT